MCFLRGKNWISSYYLDGFQSSRHCHGSGGYSPASHRGCPGLVPGQTMWDLWWTGWH